MGKLDIPAVDIEDVIGREVSFMKRKDRSDDTSREVLADLMCDLIFDKELRHRIANGKPLSAVVTVPTADWADPIADAVASFGDNRIIVHGFTKPDARIWGETAARMSAGRCIVGISHDPRRCIPEPLRSNAEIHLSAPPVDVKTLAKLLRKCQGPVRTSMLQNIAIDLLSFDDITSVVVIGGDVRDTIRRLVDIAARKTAVGTRRDTLPRLEDAIEYGGARLWALDLKKDLEDYRAGLIGWSEIDRGCVLFGPPGTGKTLLARMLGEGCGINVVVASMGDFFANGAGHLDSVLKAQRQAFEDAKSKAPCILFLDEINALPDINTLEPRGKDWWAPIILDFYTLLDGALEDREGVIVVGATNRLQDINPALLRPGRLERAIYVGPPDALGVERIMRHHLGGSLADADMTAIAEAASAVDMTGAIIMERLRAARRDARRAKRDIGLDDVKRYIVGEDYRSEAELRQIAVHECGHALISTLTGSRRVRSISIMGGAGHHGAVTYVSDRASAFRTKRDYENLIRTALAGRAAEEVCHYEPGDGAGGSYDSDLAWATQYALSMKASLGYGSSLVFRGNPQDVFALINVDSAFRFEIDVALRVYYEQAVEILRNNREALDHLVQELLKKKFLNEFAVFDIIAQHCDLDCKSVETV